MVTLTQAGITFYLPYFIQIKSYFHVSNHLVALTLTSYAAGYALAMLFWGWLSDHIGRKKALLTAASLFSVCAFLCAVNHSIGLFILLRFFQGAGGGGCAVISRTAMRDLHDGPLLAKAMSYISGSFILAAGLFQLLGGTMEKFFPWHSVFWVMTLLGIAGVLLVSYFFHETKPFASVIDNKKKTLRSVAQNYFSIIKSKRFMLIAIIGGISYGISLAYNTIAPFLLQVRLHLSPQNFGLLGLLISLIYAFHTIIASYLVTRINAKKIILMGFALILTSGTTMLALYLSGIFNVYVVVIPMLCSALGQSLIYPVAIASALKPHRDKAGYATALFGFTQQILGSTASLIASLSSHNTPVALATIMMSIATIGLVFFISSQKSALFLGMKLDTDRQQ